MYYKKENLFIPVFLFQHAKHVGISKLLFPYLCNCNTVFIKESMRCKSWWDSLWCDSMAFNVLKMGFDNSMEMYIFFLAWNLLAYVHLIFWLILNILMNVWDRGITQMSADRKQALRNKTCYHSYQKKKYKAVFAAQKKDSLSVAYDLWLILLCPHTAHLSFSSSSLFQVIMVMDTTEWVYNFTPSLMTTSRIFNDTSFDLSAFKSLKQGSSRSFLSEDFTILIDLVMSSIFMLVWTHQSQALYQRPPEKLRSPDSCSHCVFVIPSNNEGWPC